VAITTGLAATYILHGGKDDMYIFLLFCCCLKANQDWSFNSAAANGEMSPHITLGCDRRDSLVKVGIDIGLDVGDIRHPASTSVIPISEQKMPD
jgi:hypothetical protein